MKKRLLSAVLALAMALTLLPMSLIAPSFAAAADGATISSPVSGKSTVQYVHGTDYSKKVPEGSDPLRMNGPGSIRMATTPIGPTVLLCPTASSPASPPAAPGMLLAI